MSSIRPSNTRFYHLAVVILGTAAYTLAALTDLHLGNSHLVEEKVWEKKIEMDKLPAQRGLIMDSQENILTNNIQSAEITVDRYHLRELNVVVEGLAYNLASHSTDWAEATKSKREELISKTQGALIKKAKIQTTQEEREELRKLRDQGHEIDNDETQRYDQSICEAYYREHDKLIAEILYPYLKNDRLDHKKETIPGLSKQEIIDLIEQPEVKAAKAADPESKLRYRQNFTLAKCIPIEKANSIQNTLDKARVRGLSVQSSTSRFYTNPTLASHVLGSVNYYNNGISGVELSYNNYLKGIDGLREFRRDPRGKVVPNGDDRYLSAKHGLNLRLTIDMRIQSIAEDELDKGMRRFRAKKGCVIIVEPQTGNILAMVSRPSTDLNNMDVITHKDRLKHNNTAGENGKALGGEFNFATQARYEPGSTMKVVTAIAAIDKGVYNINSVISTSDYNAGGAIKRVPQGRYHYGPLPLWAVLKKSSNPGTARVALACKWPVIEEYMTRLGLTTSTGICLPSGGKCLISDGTKLVNLSRMAYGYSISVSPLHMAMVYATIANKGVRMKPRLIDKIIAPDGSIYEDTEPEVACQAMKASTAKDLMFALQHVTMKEKPNMHGMGTATKAAIPGINLGGKTGTAWKIGGGGKYKDDSYTVSFAGVLPIENPRYVIMTVIDDPISPGDRGIGGGTISAPIFRRIAKRLIQTFNIPLNDEEAFKEFCIEDEKLEAEQMKEADKIAPSTKKPTTPQAR